MTDLKMITREQVEELFKFWLEHTDYYCECCKNYHYIQTCPSDSSCPDYHVLTEDEIMKKGLKNPPPYLVGLDDVWSCLNTDDCEFCKPVQKSPCGKCMKNNFNDFDWNGQIR